MKACTLKEIIRRKNELETGAVAPGRVTEIKLDSRGRGGRVEHDPVEWQKKQAVVFAGRVAAARRKLDLTQEEFSRLLSVSRRTVENWEQGHRIPTGAARVLIEVAVKNPKAVLEAVA